ncbi:MAG: phosphate uptake regulator PhoU [Prevotella sp.]|nr:phosphate uptake regulator PhoU [Prevotella sp.]MCH4182075.1 phosphate uptake regulator PhoU [Prevotella sp.]MCH4212385.1 phosphate uptake regulator PhoU [Prevotella sp.]MCH4241446.1 phosphate uptake regulator PhoU [Prevotella sp.]
MAITKDNALHSISIHFNEMVKIVMRQLDIMDKLFVDHTIQIPSELQEEIKENEDMIDEYETSLGNEIIDIIVLQNPVASDIRKIMSVYQIISNLERIGDQVKNIDKLLPRIEDKVIYEHMVSVISNMMASSIMMVKKSISSFVDDDNNAAVWTIRNDSVVDEINHKLIKDTIRKSHYSNDIQHLLFTFINLNSIISNIERIADHATNIAEASIYANIGENLRHSKTVFEDLEPEH